MKERYLIATLLATLIPTVWAANAPIYNCQSDALHFNVSISVQDGLCVWRVSTGYTEVDGYMPTKLYLYSIKFGVKNPTLSNCAPVSFNATKMVYDNISLSCYYTPKGAMNRPQEMPVVEKDFTGYQLQRFNNNKWERTESCQSDTQNCRLAK